MTDFLAQQLGSTKVDPKLYAALSNVIDPELRLPITELGMVAETQLVDSLALATIRLTVVNCPAADRIKSEVEQTLLAVSGVKQSQVTLAVMTPTERKALIEKLQAGRPKRQNQFGPDSLTRVIAISSGKGGVGKSTITTNLAVQLVQLGYRVGLIDADVFGFSIPAMLGLVDESGTAVKPTQIDQLIVPPVGYGVKTISIGMFLSEKSPVSWRGPMLHRTLEQFLSEVHFGDLDFLLVDLPPGTGDVAISFGQLLPQAEVLVITTPQSSAAEVAWRSGKLAQQSGQKVLGVVENLAPAEINGVLFDLFGSGGGTEVAATLTENPAEPVEVLANVPIDPNLRLSADNGTPLVLTQADSPAAKALIELAQKLSIRPAQQKLSGKSLPFSTI